MKASPYCAALLENDTSGKIPDLVNRTDCISINSFVTLTLSLAFSVRISVMAAFLITASNCFLSIAADLSNTITISLGGLAAVSAYHGLVTNSNTQH